MKGKLILVFKTARLPFLTLSPVCVFLGMSVSCWRVGHINWFYAALALLGALLSHVSVNAFSEYFDFKSGLDLRTAY